MPRTSSRWSWSGGPEGTRRVARRWRRHTAIGFQEIIPGAGIICDVGAGSQVFQDGNAPTDPHQSAIPEDDGPCWQPEHFSNVMISKRFIQHPGPPCDGQLLPPSWAPEAGTAQPVLLKGDPWIAGLATVWHFPIHLLARCWRTGDRGCLGQSLHTHTQHVAFACCRCYCFCRCRLSSS